MASFESYFDENGELVTVSDEIGETSASFYGFPQFRNAKEATAAYLDGTLTLEELNHELSFFKED